MPANIGRESRRDRGSRERTSVDHVAVKHRLQRALDGCGTPELVPRLALCKLRNAPCSEPPIGGARRRSLLRVDRRSNEQAAADQRLGPLHGWVITDGAEGNAACSPTQEAQEVERSRQSA